MLASKILVRPTAQTIGDQSLRISLTSTITNPKDIYKSTADAPGSVLLKWAFSLSSTADDAMELEVDHFTCK